MIEFNGKKILVLGLQKSGKAAIRLLKTLNVEIFVSDEKVNNDFIEGTTYIEYSNIIDYLDKINIIIKSPGIKYDIDILKKARQKNILIISEIELAYHFIDKNKVIVGITGTNGKTTTTSIITKILLDSNVYAVSVGNIGFCLSDAIIDKVDADVFIVELSSFQLLDIINFRPHIGVILNISEAHIDYHNTYDNYINAKMNIFKNMTHDDFLIYNSDDKLIRKKVKKAKCKKYSFSTKDIDADTYTVNDNIIYNGRMILKKDEVNLLGEHNLYNILAAINIAKVFYIENDNIKNTIKNFNGLPHRIEKVDIIDNITYYNDSKSTNVNSTICALNSFSKQVIIILGGLDRNQDYSEIINHKNVSKIIAIGQTKEKIFSQSEKHKRECYICNDLFEAVKLSKDIRGTLDTVLFSPASASWDQYESYEERGNKFIEYVNLIKQE